MTKQDSPLITIAGVVIIAIIVLLMSCAPMPIEDTPPAQEWLNANPGLEFGGCETVVFKNADDNREYIRQCWPDGYSLYAVIGNYPIRLEFTGAAYSVRPLNTFGSIGLRLPPMTLSPGQYIIKAYGDRHMWGTPEDFNLSAHCTIEGVEGVIFLGADDMDANGSYRAMYTLNAPQAGVYNCAVYLRITHPSMTADSYMTFERITVEKAPE
jgi:hypothetical protein